MRICLHTVRELTAGFVGGTERILIELAKELTFLGHDPFIVTTGTRGEMELEGISVQSTIPDRYRKPYRKFGFANTAFITREIMKDSTSEKGLRALGTYVDSHLEVVTADVFHLNSFATSAFSRHACEAIVTNHENLKEYDRKWGAGFTDRLAQIVRSRNCELHHASLLTTPSVHYADYYANAFDLSVTPIRNGVSLTTFDRQRRRKIRSRTPKKSTLSVLLPARFDPHQKGHDIAMAACKILVDRGLYVEFTSEALALGIPTVLSDIPTYLEIAGGYAHAKFFPSENAEALATALIEASRVPSDIADQEAIRFRIANDLRAVAIELHDYYRAATRNRSGA